MYTFTKSANHLRFIYNLRMTYNPHIIIIFEVYLNLFPNNFTISNTPLYLVIIRVLAFFFTFSEQM